MEFVTWEGIAFSVGVVLGAIIGIFFYYCFRRDQAKLWRDAYYKADMERAEWQGKYTLYATEIERLASGEYHIHKNPPKRKV